MIMKLVSFSELAEVVVVGRLFTDVIHSIGDRHLLLPVDALDVSNYESTYLSNDVVIP